MTARTVPYDLPAEEAILAAALQSPAAIDVVAGTLTDAHFYLQRNGDVWGAISAVHSRAEGVDIPTVASELRRNGQLEAVGGVGMLAGLLATACDATSIASYARAVMDAYRRRQMIEAGGTITALGYDEGQSLAESLEAAESLIYGIAQGADTGEGYVSLATAAQARADAYAGIMTGGAENPGVPTGIAGLDERLLRTLKPGQLITVAARPSMGKTALALSIARYLGGRGKRVGIVSLEMSRDELIDRLVSMETGLHLDRITNYELTPAQEGEYLSGIGTVHSWPVHIDDQSGQSVSTIRARARRLHQRTPLSLLIVDYLQLITPPPGTEGNEVAALTTISRGLKILARELGIPVVALSQLNRELEKRSNKVPQLSDLRGSGGIEQDSDVVIFIYRDEVYNPQTKVRGVAELHVAKHRNGPTGMGPAAFVAKRALFTSLSSYQEVEGYG